MRLLGRTSGIFGEPAGVTGLAGLRYLARNGVIKSDEKIVAIVTGNGLKDVRNAIAAAGEPIRIEPSMQRLVEELERRNNSKRDGCLLP